MYYIQNCIIENQEANATAKIQNTLKKNYFEVNKSDVFSILTQRK